MSVKKKRRYVNDILLCIGILLVALIAFLVFKATMKDGGYVVVSIDGKEKYRYSLNKDAEHLIKNGEYENLLCIKDGKAYVTEANCRDKICVSHRAVSKTGETIVCLPHKLVISVEDEANED